jgi:hypothetical protein
MQIAGQFTKIQAGYFRLPGNSEKCWICGAISTKIMSSGSRPGSPRFCLELEAGCKPERTIRGTYAREQTNSATRVFSFAFAGRSGRSQ